MEGVVAVTAGAVNSEFWRGRRVLVTGHTGFKGSWLTLWLSRLGARVTGVALEAEPESAFVALGLADRCQHEVLDVRDRSGLATLVESCDPEVVFHLAAQAIVLDSYDDPVATYDVNVGGTINVLEALKSARSARACIVVTSDKCYENREWPHAYRETDPLGGHDPYSSSKACAEIVTASWRRSFFAPTVRSPALAIASARAGNVYGGGDFARHRLVPDLARAFREGAPGVVRNPQSVRPWQHVIDPLRGYLVLAEACCRDPESFASAYNFGPAEQGLTRVAEVAGTFASAWGNGARWEARGGVEAPHEAGLLKLDWGRSRQRLGWRPVIDLDSGLRLTADWYRAHALGSADLVALSESQLEQFGGGGTVR